MLSFGITNVDDIDDCDPANTASVDMLAVTTPAACTLALWVPESLGGTGSMGTLGAIGCGARGLLAQMESEDVRNVRSM